MLTKNKTFDARTLLIITVINTLLNVIYAAQTIKSSNKMLRNEIDFVQGLFQICTALLNECQKVSSSWKQFLQELIMTINSFDIYFKKRCANWPGL